MSTELDVGKKVIVMKTGLALFVKAETAEKLELATTADDFQHCFVKIEELGETINTSQVEGFYTAERYGEILRIKAGESKCAWGTWHTKRDKCECEAEARAKKRREDEERKRAEENKPMTPEEKAASIESWTRGNEEAALRGSSLFRSMYAPGNRNGKKIRRSTILAWEEKNGKANVEGLMIEEDVVKKKRKA